MMMMGKRMRESSSTDLTYSDISECESQLLGHHVVPCVVTIKYCCSGPCEEEKICL
jgi:hypothetical protein